MIAPRNTCPACLCIASFVIAFGWLNHPTVVAAPPPTTSFDTPTLSVPKYVASTQPAIDARPDNIAWRDAAVISSLPLCKSPPKTANPKASGKSATSHSPATSVPITFEPTPTEVRVMWNDKDLFIRFRCVDDNIYAPHGTTNGVLHSDGDVAEIFIDPVGDQRQFYELQCNPVGGHFEGLHVITTQPSSDADGVLSADVLKRDAWFILNWEIKGLEVAAAPFDDGHQHGWIADFALPAGPVLKRLGVSKFAPMKMRINFVRYDVTPHDANSAKEGLPNHAVDMAWSPVMWGRPHRSPALMGTIELEP